MKTKAKVIIKIFLISLGISTVFCTNTFAVTKSDIIGYVNSQTVCGDTSLFNTYKRTFTRLLKQKRLTANELNTIYSYLQSSVGVLNKNGVCKIADLGKLTSNEKNSVYNNLTTAAGIITNAPMLEFGEEDSTVGTNNNTGKENNTDVETNINTNVNANNDTNNITSDNISKLEKTDGTKITINTQDNTMDVYENGVLVDKVSMSTPKMTYTGVSITHVLIVVVSVLLFILALTTYIILSKKHTAKTRFVKNMLVSVMICSSLIGLGVSIFGSKLDKIKAMIDLISINNSGGEIKVELNEDKSIKKYPSYGSNYATLSIKSLGVENNVYFGDISSILSVGIGHSTWSDMPTEGGTVVYSGHNREDMLNDLEDASIGDKITVDTSYATCTYEVSKTEILKDTQIDKLNKVGNEETLILYTCYPFDTYIYTNQRFVVYSTLKEIKWK